MSTVTLVPVETGIVFYHFGSFCVYYSCTMHMRLRLWHIHYRDREKSACWEFYTKRVAGARNIICQCPFLSQNSLMIFWNSWPTITGQWSFRLTHGVVADAGWLDRVANVLSRGYDYFHLTGTYYYTEKGLFIKFYACVKYSCRKSFCPYSLLLFRYSFIFTIPEDSKKTS